MLSRMSETSCGMSYGRGMGGRNAEIEMLRFLFAVLVLLCHSKAALAETDWIFTHGSLAVEFFFLLSGYLMMASLNKRQTISTDAFVWRKIKGFWPELFVSVVLAFAVYAYSGVTVSEFLVSGINTVLSSLMFLRMTGITLSYTDWNGPTWYLSSMVIGMLLVYPVLRRYGTHVLVLLFSLILLGFLHRGNGQITTVYHWNGICFSGNLRAVGELLLGAFAWQGAQWLRGQTLGVKLRALLALVKWLGVVFVLFISHVAWCSWDGACLVALWCVIVIAFSGQSLDRSLFQNRFCLFLGAFSLPLYLSHRVWTFRLGNIVDISEMNRWEILLLLGGFSVVSALVTMGGARALRYFWKRNISA